MSSTKLKKIRSPMPPMLSVADVAERLQLCAKTIRRAIATGELHVHQIGRRYRVAEDDLMLFIVIRNIPITLQALSLPPLHLGY